MPEDDRCPLCRGEIDVDATVCRHCGSYEYDNDGWVRKDFVPEMTEDERRWTLFRLVAGVAVLLLAVWWAANLFWEQLSSIRSR